MILCGELRSLVVCGGMQPREGVKGGGLAWEVRAISRVEVLTPQGLGE